MKDRRNKFTGEFKTRIALEAIKGHRTVSEIASECGVHPHQITQWKRQALEGLPEVLRDCVPAAGKAGRITALKVY